MPATHNVVKRLAVEGRVKITQKGAAVGDLDKIKGPYRVRLPN